MVGGAPFLVVKRQIQLDDGAIIHICLFCFLCAGLHTHPTHLDNVSGADLRASGDWRLYLIRPFSEIMELVGCEEAAQHEHANAGPRG